MHTQSNTQRERLHKLKAQEAKLRHHLSNNLEKRMFEINQLLVSTDVDPEGKTLWHIKYEDSDEEDLDDDECRIAVCLNHKL